MWWLCGVPCRLWLLACLSLLLVWLLVLLPIVAPPAVPSIGEFPTWAAPPEDPPAPIPFSGSHRRPIGGLPRAARNKMRRKSGKENALRLLLLIFPLLLQPAVPPPPPPAPVPPPCPASLTSSSADTITLCGVSLPHSNRFTSDQLRRIRRHCQLIPLAL